MTHQCACSAAVAVAMLASTAAGQFAYDELVDGDITGDRFNPLQLNAADGVNTLSGTVVDGDIDYFRFTVPREPSAAPASSRPASTPSGTSRQART